MADLARPMLAEVLACVEGLTDPADAQETLVARGLLPEGWCDVARRGWHERQARDDGWGDWRDVVLPAPRTIPDLVAVASLGWDAVHRAEELAREACRALREYGCPQPQRVVWMVGERRRRRGQWVPIAWTAPGGSIPAFSDVFSVDGFWFPEHGPEVPIPSAIALWGMGLALDAIDHDAVRITVPPVGGGRG